MSKEGIKSRKVSFNFNFRSLAVKLMVSIILISTVPLITFGLISYNHTLDEITLGVNNNLLNLSGNAAQGIDQMFESLEVAVKGYASAAPETDDREQIKAYLEEVQKGVGDTFETIFITDLSGKTIAFSNQDNNVYLNDRSYFQPALNGETLVSEIVISKQSNNFIVVVATPFKIDGQVAGVFGATVPITKMLDIVNNIKVGKTGYAYMVDNRGVVIAHPDKDKIMRENLINTNVKELKDALLKSVAGETGSAIYTYEGVTKYMAYAPVKTTSWSIGVTAPTDDPVLFGEIKEMQGKLVLTLTITLIIVLIVSFILVRIITKPVLEITNVAQVVSTGDLRVHSEVKSKDEIGKLSQAFNNMIFGLRQLVSQIHTNASALASASAQISSTSEHISAGSEEQTNYISEISTSIQQLAAAAEEVSNSAQIANDVGKETYAAASNGQKVINNAVEGMNFINENVVQLGKASAKIGEIIQVIDDIAEQTNLLALNAAIEAARAGEHGKGFTVVAEEVKKLAERSSLATKEIDSILNDIQSGTTSTINAVEKGTELTHAAGEAFNSILGKIQENLNMIANIETLAKEQAVQSHGVVSGIENIVAVSEETTSVIEEATASAQELSAMAQELEGMIASFKM